MAEILLTTKELQNLYLKEENSKILKELFGEDETYFDFEAYKEKSGWDNKGFNPLHQLIDLAEFLTASAEGKSEEEKESLYKEVVNNFVMA